MRMNYKKKDETSGRHNKSTFCNVGESQKTVNSIDCTKKQKKQLEEIVYLHKTNREKQE